MSLQSNITMLFDNLTSNIVRTLSYSNQEFQNLTEYVFDLGPKRDSLSSVIPITVIYILIFISGLVGNVCTCTVIYRNRHMRTATNYYLFSLAVSDLLLLILGEYHIFLALNQFLVSYLASKMSVRFIIFQGHEHFKNFRFFVFFHCHNLSHSNTLSPKTERGEGVQPTSQTRGNPLVNMEICFSSQNLKNT